MECGGIPRDCPVSFSWHMVTSELHSCSFADFWIPILVLKHPSTAFTKHLLCALFCVLYLLFTVTTGKNNSCPLEVYRLVGRHEL